MEKRTQKQKTGSIGEDLAVKFLVKHGYIIVERNYLKKFGEIDVICRKDGKLHFVEVKSVSPRTTQKDTHGIGWKNTPLKSSGGLLKSYTHESVVRGSRETSTSAGTAWQSVSRETSDEYRPEDNIHASKLKRIGRTIEAYLIEKDIKEDWEFHAITVVLDKGKKTANVRFLKNLII